MKFNSRLLISELFAAAATALVSAILIAGCASGERTGKFWDKGDINSSDAYVAAEMARDQSIAAKDQAAPSTSGKVAFTSGAQDGTTGHVAVGDFPDPPPVPLGANATPVSSGKADAGSTAALGAQNAGAAVASAEIAGTAAGGSIVAPYVQKRSPTGPVDNSCHDGEILKPKTVSAKQLDPFAETDAEPVLVPRKVAQPSAPPAAALVNSAATAPPAATPPSTAHATLPSGNAFAESDSAQTPVVSTKANTNPVPMELVPSEQPSAPATPAAPASAASVEAFDPSTPPPIPTGATSPVGPPPAAPQPAPPQSAPERVATVMPAPPAFVPPKSVTIAAPARPHAGIRLGDESLSEDQPSAARPDEKQPDEKQVVEPAATEPAPEAHPNVAATPYEADTRHEVDTHGCVTSPPAPVGNPASVPAPATPSRVQDTWEGTKDSKPETPPSGQSAPVAAPVHVAAVVPAPAEPSRAEQASATPDLVPLFAIPQRAATVTAAPVSAAPTKTVAARESVAAPKIIEQSKDDGGSEPMILDSASVHGRYTGNDSPPPAPAPNPFDAAPASSPVPAAKKANTSIEGKSTSFWDDAFGSPALKHTVSTADFSVPVPPLPLEDDCQSIGIKGASSAPGAALAATRPAHEGGSSRSHAWFVIGMVAGLAVSAVVWRRWRDHSDPPSEPQLD
jgi:hypothetical protein